MTECERIFNKYVYLADRVMAELAPCVPSTDIIEDFYQEGYAALWEASIICSKRNRHYSNEYSSIKVMVTNHLKKYIKNECLSITHDNIADIADKTVDESIRMEQEIELRDLVEKLFESYSCLRIPDEKKTIFREWYDLLDEYKNPIPLISENHNLTYGQIDQIIREALRQSRMSIPIARIITSYYKPSDNKDEIKTPSIRWAQWDD